MLLLADDLLEGRRRAARGPLAPLYDSLASELEPLVGRDLYIPRDKALLSRAGGRCEKDGTTLEFDPWSPQTHRCPACGSNYSGELHHRAWITWYHLWLAERAVHAALFHLLRGEARHALLARDILRACAGAYHDYPNRDNVLGPTRPFFSTYLESIWLLQICVAANMVERSGDASTAALVHDRIVEPSSALIVQFDEGRSNRQVWNNAALMAASLVLRHTKRADAVVHAQSGVATHLSEGLLSDGTWFEGDNYHQFAIRGLWYCVAMCESNGIGLSRGHTESFGRGVAATFASALPDFTFPSRKDSQYAVSLRQWRFAELAELGFARNEDEQLAGALARCYEPGHARLDIGRSRSSADAERNVPSSLLTRADLSWRALLHARPALPELRPVEVKSVNLMGQGFAIFRRPSDVYVALDYGQTGAGHGHPDRLNLLLNQGATRWLDDLGTGSYVDKSLHWYRSSLAHNAPFVNGRSQRGADGSLTAHDERGEFGWVEARFVDGDVALTRTIVVTPHYLVDELAWTARQDTQVDLPWHVNATPEGVELSLATVDGGAGPEDGFDFATDWATCAVKPGQPVSLQAQANGRVLSLTFLATGPTVLMRATGPAQPASKMAPFYMVRFRGVQGRLRTVVAWDAAMSQPEFDGDRVMVESDGTRHTHLRTPAGWRVDVSRSGVNSTVELGGRIETTPSRRTETRPVARTRLRQDFLPGGWWSELKPADRKGLMIFELGEDSYRRSEESWREAGSPTATVAVTAGEEALALFIDVRASGQRFAAASATNRLDNEHPDTMGAGVQLYVRDAHGRGMWTLVPEPGSERVRVREISGSDFLSSPVARWRLHQAGYELHVRLPILTRSSFAPGTLTLGGEVDVDVVINDAVQGRERRRGQLVIAGARGQFVYLRGDREDESHSVHLDVLA